jgi:uncharacterized SAM-binding protein YcdF (DUF218 family)
MSAALTFERGAARWRRSVAFAAATAAGFALWLCWHPFLALVGGALVVEDPLAPADLLVVSMASPVAGAFEAARLYRDGYAPEIVLPGTVADPYRDDLRQLGIVYPAQTALEQAVLERSGVPPAAIRALSDPIDGTEAEVAAIAAFAETQHPRRLLIVTARSHSARTGWLLRRALPRTVEVIVRSPRDDEFEVASWWHFRWQAREVALEYLRWINALLGDLWH